MNYKTKSPADSLFFFPSWNLESMLIVNSSLLFILTWCSYVSCSNISFNYLLFWDVKFIRWIYLSNATLILFYFTIVFRYTNIRRYCWRKYSKGNIWRYWNQHFQRWLLYQGKNEKETSMEKCWDRKGKMPDQQLLGSTSHNNRYIALDIS